MSIVDKKRVKFTSFDWYCVYNVLCLTFRRNPRVLIEKKILEVISRKNRDPTKLRRTDGNKAKDCTAVHHAAQPCCSHRGHARPCVCQCVGAQPWVCQCVGARPCVEARPCACPEFARSRFFSYLMQFLLLIWGRPLDWVFLRGN